MIVEEEENECSNNHGPSEHLLIDQLRRHENNVLMNSTRITRLPAIKHRHP